MNAIRKFLNLLILFLFVLILISCRAEESESSFREYLPTNCVNNEIQLSIPSNPDQLQDSSEEINLDLSNHSEDLIRFPIDYGIQLYVYNSQLHDWEKIKNSTTYSYGIINIDEKSAIEQIEREGGIPLYPKGSPFGKPSNTTVFAVPVIRDRQLPIKIRVLVVGTIFRDDQPTDEKVAAYYDILIDSK